MKVVGHLLVKLFSLPMAMAMAMADNERRTSSTNMSLSDIIYDCSFTPKAQQLKIPKSNSCGENSYAFANVSGDATYRCSTPRAQEFKIPEVFLCPQVPRKRKAAMDVVMPQQL